MSSLKAVLVQDFTGNALFDYFSDGCKVNANLISGMLSAFNMYSREVFGGDIKSLRLGNGISLVFNDFYVKREFIHDFLAFTHGFDLNELLVRKDGDDYFTAVSVPSGFEGKRVSFNGLLKSGLGVDKRCFKIFDYDSESPVHEVRYKTEFRYAVSDVPVKDSRVVYCMVYDCIDDSLGGFVGRKMDCLGRLLKERVNLLGPALLYGEVELLGNLKPVISEFFNDYGVERDKLVITKSFSSVPARVSDGFEGRMKNVLDKLLELVKKQGD